MSQPGLFDLSRGYGSLDAKADPLVALNQLIPWEEFRPRLRTALEEAELRTKADGRKSPAGRKPFDVVMMFKVLVLQSLYNLNDDALEYQIRDRLSFMRFLGLHLEGSVPDAKTVWLYREALAETGAVAELSAVFDAFLRQRGYLTMGGQIVDATLVAAPRNRNSRDENETFAAGIVPEDWKQKPAKLRQKDLDTRWTKKNDISYYGYKNHISVDRRHKLVRCYTVTDAARHDSQELDAVLDPSNTARDVWADSAYRSAAIEARLTERHFRSRIHRRAYQNKGLTEREKRGNTARSRVRARVEHVFGNMTVSMGGSLVRTIGIVRARTKLGMQNLSYNLKRFVLLETTQLAAA